MNKLLSILLLTLVAGVANAALYQGDVTGGGTFFGSTTRNDAWSWENPIDGDELNFWSFSGQAGDTVTLSVFSLSNGFDAAISVYSGQLTSEFQLIVPGFSNSGDFAGLGYIGGSPFYGTAGNDALLTLLLPTTGVYTIAVGGESFLSFDSSYDYRLEVDVQAVPLPAAAWLFGSGVLGLATLRRRRV